MQSKCRWERPKQSWNREWSYRSNPPLGQRTPLSAVASHCCSRFRWRMLNLRMKPLWWYDSGRFPSPDRWLEFDARVYRYAHANTPRLAMMIVVAAVDRIVTLVQRWDDERLPNFHPNTDRDIDSDIFVSCIGNAPPWSRGIWMPGNVRTTKRKHWHRNSWFSWIVTSVLAVRRNHVDRPIELVPVCHRAPHNFAPTYRIWHRRLWSPAPLSSFVRFSPALTLPMPTVLCQLVFASSSQHYRRRNRHAPHPTCQRGTDEMWRSSRIGRATYSATFALDPTPLAPADHIG